MYQKACPDGPRSGLGRSSSRLRLVLSSGARAASHLGGSRVCVGRCDVPAGGHAQRQSMERERAWAFVRIRLLWRLAKRAKRLSKTQNGTTP